MELEAHHDGDTLRLVLRRQKGGGQREFRRFLVFFVCLFASLLGWFAWEARHEPAALVGGLAVFAVMSVLVLWFIHQAMQKQDATEWSVELNDESLHIRIGGKPHQTVRCEGITDLRLLGMDGHHGPTRHLSVIRHDGAVWPILRLDYLDPNATEWRQAVQRLREEMGTATETTPRTGATALPTIVRLPTSRLIGAVWLGLVTTAMLSLPIIAGAIFDEPQFWGAVAAVILPGVLLLFFLMGVVFNALLSRHLSVSEGRLRLLLAAWRSISLDVAVEDVIDVHVVRCPTHPQEFRKPPDRWPWRIMIDLGGDFAGEAVVVHLLRLVREVREDEVRRSAREVRAALGFPSVPVG